MMKNKNLILFITVLNISTGLLDARIASRFPRHPINLPSSRAEQFQQDLINRIEEKYADLSNYLKKVKGCFKDQTCSAKVLKQAGNTAAILAILAGFAYVGTKAVARIREEDMIAVPVAVEPIKLAEKPMPAFPEVPKGELVYPEEERIEIAVVVPPDKPVIIAEREIVSKLTTELKVKINGFFKDIQNLKPENLRYPDIVISTLETKYKINASSKILRHNGRSLIGAAMQTKNLDEFNRIELIRELKSAGVVPTLGEKREALKTKNEALIEAVFEY